MDKGYTKEEVQQILRDAAEAEKQYPPQAVPRWLLKKWEKLKKAKNESSSKDK